MDTEAINIQIEAIKKMIPDIPGMIANTRINPGELENPA
jgi:hypothetical protein